MTDKIKLSMLLEEKPWNAPLLNGTIPSPLIDFDFEHVTEISDHFKPMIRGQYDCGELAIVTYLQAKAYDKDLILLPFVVTGMFHHKSIAYNAGLGELGPHDLAGKRVAVRTYAQTSGVWVRGVLQNEYGSNLDETTFVTFQDSHVPEYIDPPNCVRAPAGKKLVDMLLNGEVDAAAMLGSSMPNDDRLKWLIPNPDEAAKAWGEKVGFVPINHMMVAKKSLAQERPDIIREIFRLLVQARESYGQKLMHGFGVEANRKPLEYAIDYAFQQKIIPRKFSVDELFDDVTRGLGE